MNLSLWTAIREYIVAEVDLAITRHAASFMEHGQVEHYQAQRRIPALEEKSTRLETIVRDMLSDNGGTGK